MNVQHINVETELAAVFCMEVFASKPYSNVDKSRMYIVFAMYNSFYIKLARYFGICISYFKENLEKLIHRERAYLLLDENC